jgi:regulator of protease activity HflC (stomatin/prohibitin superfamily)
VFPGSGFLWVIGGLLALLLLGLLIASIVKGITDANRTITVIKPYERGVEYRDGAFVRVVQAGRYVSWGDRTSITTVDLRENTTTVGGQEVLTSDNLSVKLTLSLVSAIEDARLSIETSSNPENDLYARMQTAIRMAVAKRSLDEVLAGRQDMVSEIEAELKPFLAARGVKLISLALRDVMLTAELKRAYSDILRARKEGEAALERARGETAALRSLANAARVMKDNPALAQLRVLQTVQQSAQKGASIILNANTQVAEGAAVASAPKADDKGSTQTIDPA